MNYFIRDIITNLRRYCNSFYTQIPRPAAHMVQTFCPKKPGKLAVSRALMIAFTVKTYCTQARSAAA